MKKGKLFLVLLAAVLLIAPAVVFAGGTKDSSGGSGDLPKRIGYVTNYGTHEWYQNVIKGMQDRCDELGIELIVLDANLDMAKEVAMVEDLMARGVDALILTPVDAAGTVSLVKKVKLEGIPMVLEGNRVEGMEVLVAICDYDAGYKGGLETGKIAAERGMSPRVLAIDLPALNACVLRVDGFMDGIRVHAPDAVLVHRVDGKGSKDEALQVSTDALTQDSDINVIYGCNDNSSLGAYQAFKAAGLNEDELIICGTGLEGLAAVYALQEIPAYMVEAAMLPEKNGRTCVDAAISLFRGETLPEHIVSATVAVTKDTWEDLYGIDADGNRYPKWDAINALETEAQCTKY